MSVQSPGEGHIISCCYCVQGGKESQFYSLPFGQAVASMY